jgi:hypothetical protein
LCGPRDTRHCLPTSVSCSGRSGRPQRLALALQAALDGFVLRFRIQPDDYQASSWQGASIFADTILALVLGVLDHERTGENGRKILDRLVAGPTSAGA